MDRDGTKIGFDNELLSTVSSSIDIPVIASGGVGNLDHFVEGVLKGGASALLAASIFHFGEYSIKDVKTYLAEQNIACLLYTSPSPRDYAASRMPSSA